MNASDLLRALEPVVDGLEDLRVAHYVGGSLASSTHGIPRSSIDADVIADLHVEHVSPLASGLRDRYYLDELRRPDPGVDVAFLYTRSVPDGSRRAAGRIGVRDLQEAGWPADFAPTCYVCGPTGFVETAADLLVSLGHDPARIRTERFGPSGG